MRIVQQVQAETGVVNAVKYRTIDQLFEEGKSVICNSSPICGIFRRSPYERLLLYASGKNSGDANSGAVEDSQGVLPGAVAGID